MIEQIGRNVGKGDEDDETHLWGRSLDFESDGLSPIVADSKILSY